RPVALLNVLLVTLLFLATGRGLVYYIQKLLSARVGQSVAADLRLDLYRHLQFLSFRFHDRRRTGDLIARLIGDIRYLRDIFVSMPITLAEEVFLMAGMAVVMFFMDWQLTLLALIALPSVGIFLRMYQKPMRAAILRQREREGEIASMASEALGAIKVVQGFGREKQEIDRFSAENKRSLRTGLKASRLEAKLRWTSEITVALVTALVLWVAVRRALSGALSPGDLIVFVAYMRTFSRPIRRVSGMAERAARGAAAGQRIFRLLDTEPIVRDLPDARRIARLGGSIAFEHVTMRYGNGEPVLQDINLRIERGERVAVLGRTGSGKTSLLSLIPRFYDPTEGRVLIDGIDARHIRLASLRDGIALVFQEPVLFATTIAENIRYGKPDATMEEIVETARQAGIHHIVSALPQGYDTALGERGGTLSGGQRQAVAIARALIKNAPIVLLDEPTTGLDREAAALVVRALDRLMEGRTVLLISHQMETVDGMDRIVVLDQGRMTHDGPHARVLARNSVIRSFQGLDVEEAEA
ncbi:MAG TPA: ABC transporter ATP-binding protein, partial [Candidatus Eisenbacteria bacterium]|nr:ABC transporter ATP-binding protein [Candidatus Eisenbacteria bacterium]